MATLRPELPTNALTHEIIAAATDAHTRVGPGLFESVYDALLGDALISRGFDVRRQVLVPVRVDDREFEKGFRADLIVDDRVILELKSVDSVLPVHCKQLLTYLRLSGLKVGLILNFGAPTMKQGIKRFINSYDDLDADGSRQTT